MFLTHNSQEELNPAKLRDEAELLEPSFSENYDSVDELLSHLPLVCQDCLFSCYLLLDFTRKMRLIVHQVWLSENQNNLGKTVMFYEQLYVSTEIVSG